MFNMSNDLIKFNGFVTIISQDKKLSRDLNPSLLQRITTFMPESLEKDNKAYNGEETQPDCLGFLYMHISQWINQLITRFTNAF